VNLSISVKEFVGLLEPLQHRLATAFHENWQSANEDLELSRDLAKEIRDAEAAHLGKERKLTPAECLTLYRLTPEEKAQNKADDDRQRELDNIQRRAEKAAREAAKLAKANEEANA